MTNQQGLNEYIKTKDKGDIKRHTKVYANGIQVLNGDKCVRFYKLPLYLIDYTPPPTAKPYVQGDKFKIWIKLEELPEIQDQLKPPLRELSIWFDKENTQKIKEFLQDK